MPSPKAMQNNNTGMLAFSVPLGVVPSAPRRPSWKIHTIAPNAAISDNRLHTNACSGITALPVSKTAAQKSRRRSAQHDRQALGDRVDAVAIDLRQPGHLHGPPCRWADLVDLVELGVGGG